MEDFGVVSQVASDGANDKFGGTGLRKSSVDDATNGFLQPIQWVFAWS
ncbi:hypothetical protein CGMCC3_g14158 [Colletotrichum fructicola]|nr:uncharacterized protein CGMCC3_g14158 [Colletotrichum fructicola]KAE9569731.1 hypothetical protein CGMCC3_g14158 [Colletotrichum fructicola]